MRAADDFASGSARPDVHKGMTTTQTRSAKAEIKNLGLKISPFEYIVSEYKRSRADLPKADPVSAARGICELYGMQIDPQILVDAAK